MTTAPQKRNGRLAWIVVTVLAAAFLTIFTGAGAYLVDRNDEQHLDFEQEISETTDDVAEINTAIAEVKRDTAHHSEKLDELADDVDDLRVGQQEILRRLPPS